MNPTLTVFCIISLIASTSTQTYEPNWNSLDTRPIPDWYDDAKVGIFIHWGVYSVPSFKNEWFWAEWNGEDEDVLEFIENNYPPGFTYQKFAKDFTAEFYDPVQWAQLFNNSGARYVVLTSKHHEGYTLWPSTYSYSWNSMDIGPHRDLVGELAEAVRSNTDLHFGLYYSLLEWYNPMYLSDKANNFETKLFSTNKFAPEIRELVEKYEPHVIFADGNWEADSTYWQSLEFLAWLYNESPVKDVVVVNDRWGNDVTCLHGDYRNCEDRFNPDYVPEFKWENCLTIDWASWGYRRNADISSYMSAFNVIEALVTTVSRGGNMLLNVGPTKEGVIAPIFQERLLSMGSWLAINGEAIYGTKPWTVQNDESNSNVWYTAKGNAIYAITLSWPDNNLLNMGSIADIVTDSTVITFLEGDSSLTWTSGRGFVSVNFPDKATVGGEIAWVVKIVP